jgi:hypothetical protein
MKPKSPCPICGDVKCVQTLGGRLHGNYGYECNLLVMLQHHIANKFLYIV